MEREKKRLVKEFEQMKELLREKEKGVKVEIEKIWNEWEDKAQEQEEHVRNIEKKLNTIE